MAETMTRYDDVCKDQSDEVGNIRKGMSGILNRRSIQSSLPKKGKVGGVEMVTGSTRASLYTCILGC